jgi:hypothetical protein
MAHPGGVRRLSKHQAAYIAGLVDGEGTITLTRLHRDEGRRLVLSISSTEIELLEFVLKTVGAGKITGKRTYSARHAPSFSYAITSRQALAVLEQTLPYLRSYKKSRAALVLRHYLPLTPRNGRYTNKLKAARKEFEANLFRIRANSPHHAIRPGKE